MYSLPHNQHNLHIQVTFETPLELPVLCYSIVHNTGQEGKISMDVTVVNDV